MTKIRLGPIVADARGSTGDVIFSRNRGGAYTKAKSLKPWTTSDPREAAQTALGIVAVAWRDTLTEDQRHAWREYGLRHPMPDCWGTNRLFDGYYWYTRCNFHFARAGAGVLYRVPPLAGPLPAPVYLAQPNVAGQYVHITTTLPNYEPQITPLAMWVFAGQPTSQAVTYYNAPWRYIDWYYVIAPYGLREFFPNWPFAFTAGQTVHGKIVMQTFPTGEISRPSKFAVTT